jgi:DDE superfamily endonuclease
VPRAGPSWRPVGDPVRLPAEYARGGTAKLLTLFRPATGEVRAAPVRSGSNAVLHPWLKDELAGILAALPPPAPDGAADRACWEAWQAGLSVRFTLPAELPPLRALLVWDNLTGHKTPELVLWLCAHGVMPLYTPLGGSWLNMAESVQRVLTRRALDGQHAEAAEQLMAWLAATVDGWNAAPTPFVWGGKRARRRERARRRRHALGGSGALTRRPISRRRSAQRPAA